MGEKYPRCGNSGVYAVSAEVGSRSLECEKKVEVEEEKVARGTGAKKGGAEKKDEVKSRRWKRRKRSQIRTVMKKGRMMMMKRREESDARYVRITKQEQKIAVVVLMR